MRKDVPKLPYANPFYKKMRRAYPMLVSCAACKADLIMYQKGGKGGLIKLRLDRLLSAIFPIDGEASAMHCPRCGALFAKRTLYKGHVHYFIMRGMVNTRSFY